MRRFANTPQQNVKRNVSKFKDFVEKTVPTYDDSTFKKHFRLSRSVAYRLIGMNIIIYVICLKVPINVAPVFLCRKI